ncbi:MAG: sodium/solute symporter [Acidobacteriaceae bacterium]|nr:sodium/solute symporter [Acidobacteriaceae bacterium]
MQENNPWAVIITSCASLREREGPLTLPLTSLSALALALPVVRLRLPDLALILVYLVAITIFGLRFRSGERSLKSYFLGSGTIPWWAIALSIVSAETSTLTIISVPGVAFAGDFGFLQIVFGYMIGRIVVCAIFLPKYFQGELYTAYQLIERRFGNALHKITALLFLITRAAAEGVRVFAVSIVVGIAIGTRDILSIAIITLLTLIYTFEGGIAAVIWTDVVQMFIYVGGTFVALWTLGHHVDGGWTAIHHIAGSAGKLRVLHFAFSLSQTYTFWAGVLGGTFLTMASHGTDQLMVQRLLVAKNLRESRLALLSSGVVILMQFTLFLLIGAGLYVYYLQRPATVPFASADRIFPTFIVQQMPVGVAGLLVAAILAAAMSNLSAALNSLSSTTVFDFYLRWRPQASDGERSMISRASTVMWALVLFALALLSRGGGHVVEIGLSIASVAYGSLLGVFLLGTLTKRATQAGAIVGMVTGFALNIALWIRQTHTLGITIHAHHFALPLIAWTWYVLIGAIVTFVLGYIASLLFGSSAPRAKTAVALLLLLVATQAARAQSTPDFTPIDGLVQKAIDAHQIPGAVVVIGHSGHIVFHKAYGNRSLELDHKPHVEPMTEDTIFDMASLTKCLATATALMQLYEEHRFSFDDPVAKYIPAFAANGKQSVTIRQLATHYSGLPPDLDLKEKWLGKQEAFARADASPLKSTPGTVFVYSDINYVVLQQLIETLTGTTLDAYALTHIYQPLGMAHTRFLPPIAWIPNIAPTQYDDDGTMLRGVVHDPTARRMGGVAGDAGLFSTAADISIYAQALLDKRLNDIGNFPLSRISLIEMTLPAQLDPRADNLRGIGWDIHGSFSSPRGKLFAEFQSFGHTGFTGTSLWIDPNTDSYLVILTNRVHPNGGPSINEFRSKIATVAAEALGITLDVCPAYTVCDRVTVSSDSGQMQAVAPATSSEHGANILTGIDALESTHFAQLQALAAKHTGNLRLGLLTNQTGLDVHGRRTIDILNTDLPKFIPGAKLITLFSPEHGISGAVDTTDITNSTDKATGLPVVSLYGAKDEQRRPSIDALRKLDAVVIDLQDAGVRFYTYETVTGYFLEAAAKAGIEIILLDRPNLINGVAVQGPVSDAGSESYINYMPLPVRHGLTLGELAQYINGEKHLGAKLTVIPMQGWQRAEWFDETSLPWTNPSPNLRNITAAALYPGVAFFDAANVSVGRGTSAPFEQIGAPWIDGAQLAIYLNARKIPGVSFEPTIFTATKPYLCTATCHGVHITLTDRNALDAPELGIELISALHHLYPDKFLLEKTAPLIVNAATLEALRRGDDPRAIAHAWQPALHAFQQRALPYRIYAH